MNTYTAFKWCLAIIDIHRIFKELHLFIFTKYSIILISHTTSIFLNFKIMYPVLIDCVGKPIKSTAQALESLPGTLVTPMSQNPKSTDNSANEICLTPGCIHSASNVLNAMDLSVEPCDDFYNFACGSFIRNTQIPDEKTAVNTFSVISDKLQEQLRSLITEPAKPGESAPFTLAKDLYKSCMNKTLIEERGLEPLLAITERLGGWPVIKGDRWDDKSEWTWQQSVKDFRREGYSMDYIFDFSIGVDLKNTLMRTIDVRSYFNKNIKSTFQSYFPFQIDQAATGVSREYLVIGLEDKIVKAYFEYMVDMAVIFGAERQRALRELRDSLDFEIALANVKLT